MAKYSTGGVGGDSGGACELCGAEDRSLETTTVAGARLEVCSECRKHGDDSSSVPDEKQTERDRRRKAAQNAAKLDDARSVETDWEEGADYEEDPLPYLVSGYGSILEDARQEAGLQTDELAAEIGVDEDDVVAVEQGRAARANVGGSVIEALEDRLDIELEDA
jgi:ribosome-binding protein aMBF1 (putative translation factor)